MADELEEITKVLEDVLKPVGDALGFKIEIGKGTEPIDYEQDEGEWILTIILFPVALGLCLFTKFLYMDCINNGAFVLYHYLTEAGVLDALNTEEEVVGDTAKMFKLFNTEPKWSDYELENPLTTLMKLY